MAGQSKGTKSGRAWKLERATVHKGKQSKPRSNKYSKAADGDKKPAAGERTRAWVGGYTRADGRKVKGHYREIGQSGTMRASARKQGAAQNMDQPAKSNE